MCHREISGEDPRDKVRLRCVTKILLDSERTFVVENTI
jgi:hypothetical protein